MKLKDLKPNQQQAVINLIQSGSVAEAARRSDISESRLWEWLKQENFLSVLEEEREIVFKESLALIKSSLFKATQTLVGLLDSDDERIRRAAANDLLDKVFKITETKSVQVRIQNIDDVIQT